MTLYLSIRLYLIIMNISNLSIYIISIYWDIICYYLNPMTTIIDMNFIFILALSMQLIINISL